MCDAPQNQEQIKNHKRLSSFSFEPYLMICTCCQNASYIILQNCIIQKTINISYRSNLHHFVCMHHKNHSDNTNQYYLRFVIEARESKRKLASLLLSMQINTFHIYMTLRILCLYFCVATSQQNDKLLQLAFENLIKIVFIKMNMNIFENHSHKTTRTWTKIIKYAVFWYVVFCHSKSAWKLTEVIVWLSKNLDAVARSGSRDVSLSLNPGMQVSDCV